MRRESHVADLALPNKVVVRREGLLQELRRDLEQLVGLEFVGAAGTAAAVDAPTRTATSRGPGSSRWSRRTRSGS